MSILLHTPKRGDGLGRRVKEHNVAGGTVTDRNFVWDGLEMVQWQNADGTVQRNLFAQGEQIMAGAGVETLLTVTDHLGSVRGWHRLGDGARGEAQFSAYGKRTITSNATGVPAKSFTGHYQHEASGLLLAPYRAYDPELGRWLSRDPIEEEGGINLYGYVGNGPTTRIDALGLTDSILDPLWRNVSEPVGRFVFDDPSGPVQSVQPERILDAAATFSEGCTSGFRAVTGQPIEALGPIGAEFGGIPRGLRALAALKRADFIRTGPTVVSNQLINGSGAPGATIVQKCVKGGGWPLPYHFHVHWYNWHKPWSWFSQTPIIKP